MCQCAAGESRLFEYFRTCQTGSDAPVCMACLLISRGLAIVAPRRAPNVGSCWIPALCLCFYLGPLLCLSNLHRFNSASARIFCCIPSLRSPHTKLRVGPESQPDGGALKGKLKSFPPLAVEKSDTGFPFCNASRLIINSQYQFPIEDY